MIDHQTFPQSVLAEQLMSFRRGYPILHPISESWMPPVLHGDKLITEGYMAHYTAALGDVGYIEDGKFMRLFNATRDAHDPVNMMNGVPKHFEPFKLHADDVIDKDIGDGHVFYSHHAKDLEHHMEALQHIAARTALLYAPERVVSRDYTDTIAPQLELYINKHCHDWYHFANTNFEYEVHKGKVQPHKRELQLAPDALILVTGVDLTSGWRTMISNGENSFHRGHHEFIDHYGFIYECVGDEDRRMQSHSSSLREPQTIFIRGYKFCDFRAGGGTVSRLAHAVSGFIHHELPVTGRKVFHPLDSMIQHIHQKTNAHVVITHDDMWCHSNPERKKRLLPGLYVRNDIDVIVEDARNSYFHDYTNQDIEFDWKGNHHRGLQEAHDETRTHDHGAWHVPDYHLSLSFDHDHWHDHLDHNAATGAHASADVEHVGKEEKHNLHTSEHFEERSHPMTTSTSAANENIASSALSASASFVMDAQDGSPALEKSKPHSIFFKIHLHRSHSHRHTGKERQEQQEKDHHHHHHHHNHHDNEITKSPELNPSSSFRRRELPTTSPILI